MRGDPLGQIQQRNTGAGPLPYCLSCCRVERVRSLSGSRAHVTSPDFLPAHLVETDSSVRV